MRRMWIAATCAGACDVPRESHCLGRGAFRFVCASARRACAPKHARGGVRKAHDLGACALHLGECFRFSASRI
jgi:hypothetical protein